MAQDFNIIQHRYNGTDWDNLLPKPSNHASTHEAQGEDPITVSSGMIQTGAVSSKYSATINSSDWQTSEDTTTASITINGLLSTDTPVIDIALSSIISVDDKIAVQDAWSNIYQAITSDNRLTLYATDAPSVNIPIQLLCVRK